MYITTNAFELSSDIIISDIYRRLILHRYTFIFIYTYFTTATPLYMQLYFSKVVLKKEKKRKNKNLNFNYINTGATTNCSLYIARTNLYLIRLVKRQST